MATHRVPQDVETDDKLIGFLSMKQFIFVIVGLGFGYLTFVFTTKVHFLAGLIWVPFTVIFLVLGLYQRKDQPVEVYLASAIRFYLKPHKRKWNQEGYEERVVVTVPPKIEHNYTKNFTGEEATSRLGNLSRLMDSRGWATKMTGEWQNPQLATAAGAERLVQSGPAISGIDVQQYMQPTDVMDENSSIVAQDFQARITQVDSSAKQHALQALQQARQDAGSTQQADDNTNNVTMADPTYQKYPEMKQKVVSPTVEPNPPEAYVVQTPPKITTPSISQEPDTAAAPQTPVVTPEAIETDDGSVEISLH